MMDMGSLHYFLGISVTRTSSSQSRYATEILECAGMSTCRPSPTPVDMSPKFAADSGSPVADPTTYRSLTSALQYLTFMWLNIAYAVQ